jgi:hypothetical protein
MIPVWLVYRTGSRRGSPLARAKGKFVWGGDAKG